MVCRRSRYLHFIARRITAAFVAWLVTSRLLSVALGAAGEAPRALAEGNAHLLANPPEREAARRAFERAVAAGDDPAAVAGAYFRLGALDEDEGELTRALASYRASTAQSPSSRWTRNARSRIEWMTARSEGDFVPLARLQRMRKSPELAGDPGAVEAFARDVETFPPGVVRAESRMLVGEAWLKRLHRREEGLALLRKVVDDPSASSADASFVQRDIVEALLEDGRLDDAASELRRHSFDPKLADQVQRLLRRRTLRRIAAIELVVFAGVAAVVVGRVARARGRRGVMDLVPTLRGSLWLVLLGVITLGEGLLLASRYEAGSVEPWLPVGVGAALVFVVMRALGSSDAWRSRGRAASALLCAVSVTSAAFLLLEAVDPAYLARLGTLGK